MCPTNTLWYSLYHKTSLPLPQGSDNRSEQWKCSQCMCLILKARLAIVAVIENGWLENTVFNRRHGKIVSFLPVARGIRTRASVLSFALCSCIFTAWGEGFSQAESSGWAVYSTDKRCCFSFCQQCFMEARHCLAAASVIFSQAGQVPSAEDSKFI